MESGKNYEFSGFGNRYYPDGSKYIGNFVSDQMCGSGEFYCADGTKFVGEFKDDQKDGRVTIYDKNNKITFVGLVKHDIKHGAGIEYTEDSIIHVLYVEGSLKEYTIHWQQHADNQYFGRPILTFGRQDKNITHNKTFWSSLIVTERTLIDSMTIGKTNVYFPDGITFHVPYHDGDVLNEYILMSVSIEAKRTIIRF